MTDTNVNDTAKASGSMTARYVIIAGIIIAAFFGSYSLAVARANRVTSAGGRTATRGAVPAAKTAGSSPACACCGTGGSSAPVEGAATVEGTIQKVTIDTASGSYNPNTITLKAGVPTEITFTQSFGCLGQVIFPDLGISADLSAGDTTVKLPALDAGTYGFNCGMQMVFGTLTVE
jgi:hypothetical protein